MRRYALRDDQWDRIKDVLPGREGHVGGTARDNRLFVEAVLFRFRAGVPWRDLPERFGDWKIVYQRFNRWAKSGVFARVLQAAWPAITTMKVSVGCLWSRSAISGDAHQQSRSAPQSRIVPTCGSSSSNGGRSRATVTGLW